MAAPGTVEMLLGRGGVVLLDGAIGSELERRGVDVALPLWSARAVEEAPDELARLHREYVDAGAEVITAATFRTTPRAFAGGGLPEAAARAERATLRAVGLARRAIREAGREGETVVAASLAPLEDCYRPDRVPDDATLADEHSRQAARLARAGADLILVETMGTIREAAVATAAAAATGLPVWTSFLVTAGGRLAGGESVVDAAHDAVAAGASAILVNCSSVKDTEEALALLGSAGVPLGAYANAGHPPLAAGAAAGWDDLPPAEYVRASERWVARGATLVGSCCGTGPAHVAALVRRWRPPAE